MTSPFGNRTLNGKTIYHAGIDLVCDSDKTVVATESGKVITSRIVTDKSNKTWEWGNYICIQTDDGKQIYYCHLEKRAVKTGDYVKSGTGIGIMGNTGYSFGEHLHLEVRKNNVPINAADYLGIQNKIGTVVQLEAGENMTIYNDIADIPEWAKNDILWLTKNNFLRGSEGNLKLTYDMVRMLVIMSRAIQEIFKRIGKE